MKFINKISAVCFLILMMSATFSITAFALTTEENETPVVPQYSYGDVNRDNIINISDSTEIQKSLVSLIKFDEEQTELADFDRSGYVDVKDVTSIQKSILWLFDPEPETTAPTSSDDVIVLPFVPAK